MPLRTVRSDKPVASGTAAIPPHPMSIASDAAQRLPARSSGWSTIEDHFAYNPSTTAAFGIGALSVKHHRQAYINPATYFRASANPNRNRYATAV